MDVSIIIVNYKSEEYLLSCLASLEKCMGAASHEVIIINNDKKKLESSFFPANTRILNHGTNDGFAKSCNLGVSVSSGKILFFLNPDTKIVSENIVDLFKALNDSSLGIVAPQLLSSATNVQLWSSGYAVSLWEIIKNNLGVVKNKVLWKATAPVFAGWVSGAAFAIRKELFDELAGFDEKFFMYFEDVDLCKRVSDSNKKILILPSVKVLHFGGKSASSSIEQKKQYYSSQDYYFKKHFGSFQLFLLRSLRCFH